jgi:hypothetical protein
MGNNKIAFIEGENMILCHTDITASPEFTMPPVEILMEDVCQAMDMEKKRCLMTLFWYP